MFARSAVALACVWLFLGQLATGSRFSGLCPASYPRQVRFKETGHCYTVGSPGPCPEMMVVGSNPANPNFGVCRCKSLGNNCFGRPLLEWDDRCYFEFSQGPCKRGHWLVRGKQGFATCQKNPCPVIESQKALLQSDIPENNFYFVNHQENGFTCYKTGTTAFCPEGERAYFLGTEPVPRCLRYEPWQCSHYSEEELTNRQGDRTRWPSSQGTAPGFGVPYDGI